MARSHVGFSEFQRRNLEVEERRVMPRYVEAQFVAAAREVGLRIEPQADGLWRTNHVLADLRSERVQNDVPLHGELVAVREHLPSATRGIAAQAGQGQFETVPSDILLNLPPHPSPPACAEASAGRPATVEVVDTQPASDFLKSTYQIECRVRCQGERQHFARVCREYLERSFSVRIKRAQQRAMLLAAEAATKPEYKLTADEARKQVDDLQRATAERMEGLKRLEIARTGPVRHLATAVVLAPGAHTEAQLADLAVELDPNVRRKSELAAEDLVVASLVQEGFPEDRIERLGAQKIGFDIWAHRIVDASTEEVYVKRIEVKGRERGQPVRLTTNEWYKAQQLADTYWLYVVWEPLGKNPELVRIHEPAARLDHAKREILAARFFEIPAEAVAAAAQSTEARA